MSNNTIKILKHNFLRYIIATSYLLFANPSFASQSDLGCEVITDQIIRTSSISKPGYLQSVIDPVYNAKITRVCGDPGTPITYQDGTTQGTWGSICRHEYSKQQSWNANQSVIWLQYSGIFLDGNSYKPIKLSRPTYSHEYPRWHPTNPDLMVYTYYDGSVNEVGFYNVKTKTKTNTKTFTEYGKLFFGPGEGNLSHDGNMVALFSKSTNKAFAYNLNTQQKYPDIDLSSFINQSATEPIDWVSISASGKYVVVNIYRPASQSEFDTTRVFDLNGQQVGPYWSQTSCPSHYDLTLDENGEDVAVGVCKYKNELVSDYGMVKRRLIDGKITSLGTRTQSSHTSTRNLSRLGYAYTSNPYGNPIYKNQLLSLKLDGSIVERLAYFPNIRTESDYQTEPHAVVSPDGKKILAASNWEDSSLRPIQAYIIEPCITKNNVSSSPISGDLNDDGKVNLLDFNLLISKFGNPYTLMDFNNIIANFGK